MKNQIPGVITTIFLLTSISPFSSAEDRLSLNSRQAIDVCKQAISNTFAEETRFQRNPASSLRGGAYRFWINATEKVANETNSVKYQCEITRTGQLVELTREAGRWNI